MDEKQKVYDLAIAFATAMAVRRVLDGFFCEGGRESVDVLSMNLPAVVRNNFDKAYEFLLDAHGVKD